MIQANVLLIELPGITVTIIQVVTLCDRAFIFGYKYFKLNFKINEMMFNNENSLKGNYA
jgi:hypothetical protein